MRLRFEDCVFDSDTREVLRGGQPVPIPPKVFQLLELLILERPKALSKEQIHERLWPDTFVSDANLANLAADLRAALGDDAKKSTIIRTVQRFGYAFQAEVRSENDAAVGSGSVFRLIWNGREISLGEGANILGRDRAAVAWLDAFSVSRQHARITVAGDDATIEDLGSKNGTFIRGKPVEGRQSVRDGDEIRVGTVTLTLRRFNGESTRTAHSR
ncbi:MAG TPA: FHA domain-containing protein [Thermoanaerobaculia bacterium]|jgi:DNA-binding winged helix-turn-helix (wHTH) protein|nr:FHA domain-containing protein [Thermoanaerobaculia bacterium]